MAPTNRVFGGTTTRCSSLNLSDIAGSSSTVANTLTLLMAAGKTTHSPQSVTAGWHNWWKCRRCLEGIGVGLRKLYSLYCLRCTFCCCWYYCCYYYYYLLYCCAAFENIRTVLICSDTCNSSYGGDPHTHALRASLSQLTRSRVLITLPPTFPVVSFLWQHHFIFPCAFLILLHVDVVLLKFIALWKEKKKNF